MADLPRLSLIFLYLGYQMDILCMSASGGLTARNTAVEALLIVAFLLYTAAIIVSLLVNFGELKGSFIASVVGAVLDLSAGVFLLIGLAVYGSLISPLQPPVYPTTLYSVSLIFAFLAGIVTILDIAGCKATRLGTAK